MITFSKFGKHGNLGNQLFQWAALVRLRDQADTNYVVPSWKYSSFFKTPPHQGRVPKATFTVEEKNYHYDMSQWFDALALASAKDQVVDVVGWLQSEKYMTNQHHNQKTIQKRMEFTDEHLAHVRAKYRVLDAGAPIIAISIRRGDYVDNPNYYQLPIDYYLHALYDNFDGFQDMANVMIFSDDFEYCKLHLAALPNVVFVEGSAMEQLAAMSMCDHFILANSTFSWWGAYLGEKDTSLIVRPAYHFAGEMEKLYDAKDYYPERWVKSDHVGKRFDLSDVTFTIPFKPDTNDRSENLEAVTQYLLAHFTISLAIGGPGENPVFHRTQILNKMAQEAPTPIIANWDTDVMVPIVQILEAARAIRLKKAAMVFPYDGRFARVPRTDFKIDQKEGTHKDLSTLVGKTYRGMFQGDTPSVGGAIFWDRETFLDIGGENEYFIEYGPEDVERFHRAQKLRIPIWRTPGVLYHFDHQVPKGSQKDNPNYEANERQLRMVQSMSRHNLLEYIKTWPWRHMYTAKYYHTFVESAAVSALEVFKSKFVARSLPPAGTVLDVGCGLGEWSSIQELGWEYYGIDHKIPTDKYRGQKSGYLDLDLTVEPIPNMLPKVGQKFDLVMCLEVMEHIPEEHAMGIIKRLCELSDTILFSAAIPHQQGEGHVNEQWQSYWGKMFARFGFVSEQFPESSFQENEKIDLWYRQNLMLFRADDPFLGLEHMSYDYVHPEMYLRIIDHYKNQ